MCSRPSFRRLIRELPINSNSTQIQGHNLKRTLKLLWKKHKTSPTLQYDFKER